ncbi:zinc knuckle protein [Rutstroemia sp. NJR-2017a BBW]|nr:zinc knuckle protein [Rutstroemia sp. NJR-2017a BBW]
MIQDLKFAHSIEKAVASDAVAIAELKIEETQLNVTTKISKSIGALTSLAGSTWGASVTELRRIYQAVVIPQMMYGCSAWSVAQERGEGYTKQTANSLKRLQAKAARIIGGAYKATSGAALDIELHLLPIEQQIWKTNAETVSRILSTEKIPTLAEFRILRNTRNRGRQTLYVSPLEHIYRRLYQRRGATIEEQEPIPPYIVPPCETSTVYAAELQGIKLALDIADEDAEKGNKRDKLIIFTDNQAAIRACQWEYEQRGRTSYKYTQGPTHKVLRLHHGLKKWQSALLIQMRTEKIGLRDHLWRRKVPEFDDPGCDCGEGRQTVSHILLRCRNYRDLRRREFGIQGRMDLRAILNESKSATKAIRFMEQTHLLGQFRRCGAVQKGEVEHWGETEGIGTRDG